MRRILLLQLLLITRFFVFAQKDCRSAEYRQQLINSSPQITAKIAALEAFIQDYHKSKSTTTLGDNGGETSIPTVISIPVVVHIVYNTASQNISDVQVRSQIDVLNKDYSRQNADTNYTPAVFRQFAANCGLHFELAKVDTLGYATTGIVRKHTGIVAFAIDDKIKSSASGGDDAWDKDRYLNIWVGNLSSGMLGYSSVPGGPKETDGVVILFSAFGNGGTAAAPFNKGRTTTHEIGHWLNLIHTWGDAQCGDDHVADTPPQQAASRGCPSGVVITCNNAPYGNMYSNYMDFTDDECMNLFTYGQHERMQAMFVPGGERFAMLSSNALTAIPLVGTDTLTIPTDVSRSIGVYPNPATDFVNIQLNDDTDLGSTLEIYNQVGQRVMSTIVTGTLMRLNVSPLGKGMYYLKIRDSRNKQTVKLVKM